ncbi:MAG: transcriptional repressor [Candidatus Cloacimonetes bacterium]|nr:transcriptional repressor [Candidatus Cloacimonadota bacterium]
MDKCDARNTLTESKIIVTKQRLLLMQSVLEFGCPFSASEIHANNMQISDLATVYRFFKLLQENSIIRSVAQMNDTQYYELACKHNPNHPHFLCKSCHKLSCLEAIKSSDLFRLAQYTPQQEVDDVCVIYTGTCNNCIKNNLGVTNDE